MGSADRNKKNTALTAAAVLIIAVVLAAGAALAYFCFSVRGGILAACCAVLIALLAGASAMLMLAHRRADGEIKRFIADMKVAAEQNGCALCIYELRSNELVCCHGDEIIAFRKTPEEMVEAGCVAAVSAEEHKGFYEAIRGGRHSGEAALSMLGGNGEYRWYKAEFTLVDDDEGRPDHAVITFFDNTEQIERERAFEEWNNAITLMVSKAALCVEANLTQGVIIRRLGDAGHMGEDDEQDSMDGHCAHFLENHIWPEDAGRYRSFLRRDRLTALYYNGTAEDSIELRMISAREDDAPRWFRISAHMMSHPNTGQIELLVLYTDIDNNRTGRRGSYRDSLTGLITRDALRERLEKLKAEAEPDDLMALFMIDLDNFKAVNDTYGHIKGDETLKSAASSIVSAFRRTDAIGRVGGDEFMACVTGRSPGVFERRAQEICNKTQLMVGDIFVSCTVGVCVMRAEDAEFEAMYQISDAMLYSAKNNKQGSYAIDCTGGIEVKGQAGQTPGSSTIQFNVLLEQMDGAILLLEFGPEVRVIYVSPSYYNTFGRTTSNTPAHSIVDLVHEDDIAKLIRDARESVDQGSTFASTYRAYNLDGSVGWRHLRGVRIPYEDSEYPVMMATLTDVSKLKQQEEEARISRQTFEIAMDQTNAVIWEVDIAANTFHLSKKFLAMHRHAMAAMTHCTVDEVMATGVYGEDAREPIAAIIGDIHMGKPGSSRFIRERNPEGQWLWTKYSYTMIYSEDGNPVRAIGTAEPLPNIDAEYAVIETERRLLRSIKDAVICSAEINITKNTVVNLSVADEPRWAGYSPSTYDDLFEVQLFDLYGDRDRLVCQERFSRRAILDTFDRRDTWIWAEYRRRDDSGSIRWIANRMRLFRDPVSGDVYAFQYVQDVDSRMRWELAVPMKPERGRHGYLYSGSTARAITDYIINRNRAGAKMCGMIKLELVGFAELKERRGDHAADEMLMFFARLIWGLAGENMIVSQGSREHRYAVFMPRVASKESAMDEAQTLCDKIQAVTGNVFEQHDLDIRLGVAVDTYAAAVCDALYIHAEEALEASLNSVTMFEAVRHHDEAGADEDQIDAPAAGAVDELTGCLTRTAYYDAALHMPQDALSSLGVVFADVNHLARINREHGTEFGDDVVRFLGQTLMAVFKDDKVFRVSGDEVLVLVKNCTKEQFVEDAKRARSEVGARYPGLVSFGVVWEDHGIDVAKMVESAETVMEMDKQRSDELFDSSRSQRVRIATEALAKRIKEGQFHMYLQPKLSLMSGQVESAEALVRLIDPEEGLIPPARFISLYEKERIISHLDLYILEKALELLAKWQGEGRTLPTISVNFSRITLLTPELCRAVGGLLEKYGVAPEHIEIEITENAGDVGRDTIQDICRQLRSLGLKLALDDFGSEYSSLYILSAIHFDTIKIDKSIVDDVETNESSQLTIQHIVDFCDKLGGECVAEGVETQSQLDVLKAMRCDTVQGYFINKPMPAADFESRYIAV